MTAQNLAVIVVKQIVLWSLSVMSFVPRIITEPQSVGIFVKPCIKKKKILHSFATLKCSIKYCLIFTVLLRCNLASFRMESSADDYRIQSFDMDTQMLLKTALKG